MDDLCLKPKDIERIIFGEINNNKDLTKRLKILGLRNQDFAEIIGYSVDAFKKWDNNKKGKTKVPKWLPLVLQYLMFIKLNNATLDNLDISLKIKHKL